jgi:dTDP-4-amino-4,6-dideoxygalactose transaminase
VPWYEHTEIGFNYRMSNILAALGRGQLQRLDEMIARRRAIRDLYDKHLGTVTGVRLLGRTGADTDDDDNCWLTTVVIERAEGEVTGPTVADGVVGALGRQDIEARHLWKPMHLQPAHAGRRAFLTGVSDALFASGVTLPSGAGLTDDEVMAVVDAVTRYLER